MRRITGLVLIALGIVGATAAPAGAAPDAAARQGSGPSSMPSVSADGRFVAFHSAAPDLVPGDTNGVADVFVRDLWTGRTQRISGTAGGTVFTEAISDNGRWVTFTSADHVWVVDRWTGTTTPVSVGANGAATNGRSAEGRISGDGRYVLFQSLASNLVAGASAGHGLYVRDLWTRTTRRVDVDSTEAPADSDAWIDDAAITRQGRYVVFTSGATNLVTGDTNGATDVFLRDLWSGTTERVNVSSAGGQADRGYAPNYPIVERARIVSVSADGRLVAFASDASNLLATGQPHGKLYLRDRWTGSTTAIDVHAGLEPELTTADPALSADGGAVVFRGPAWLGSALPAGQHPSGYLVHDLRTHTFTTVPGPPPVVWPASAGAPTFPDIRETPPTLNANGNSVVFQAVGTLVEGGWADQYNVFVFTRCNCGLKQASLADG